MSKASGPDCIPGVVLKNCESELSYILAKLFNKCLKGSCFPNSWNVLLVIPVFKNVGERSTAKNCHPVSLLSVVSKVFEKLVSKGLLITKRNVAFFLISSMVLGLLNQLQIFLQLYLIELLGLLTGLVLLKLDISKDFDRVWYAGLLPRLKSYGISGQIFGPISSFLSKRWLRVVLDGMSSQEYPVNALVLQGSILGLTLFLYINDLPDDVICDIAIYADDTTLYSKCDQAFDLCQQLKLASQFESDLQDTVD